MTKLSKTDLGEILEIFFLANTPVSLFVGMNRSDAVQKLKRSPAGELLNYYDRITSRKERSELVIALAYAVLCAILLRAQDGDRVTVDATRLLWGEQIRVRLERSYIRSSLISTGNSPPAVHVASSVSVSSTVPKELLGPDGRAAASWRND
jgi:hypothetical protein